MTNLEKWIDNLRKFVNESDPKDVLNEFGHCGQCAYKDGYICAARNDPSKTCFTGRDEWAKMEVKE